MEIKQEFKYNYSMLKNGLQENQRQWPVLVRDEKLTIDPVLYGSNFGPNSPGADSLAESVANTPGVRLEYLRTNSAKDALNALAEGTCTLQISNSGTFNAYATITWPDASTTRVNLVAPSTEVMGANWLEAGPSANLYPGQCPGPYPVFMTLQELCDTLDTFIVEGNEVDATRTYIQPSGFQWQADNMPGTSGDNFDTVLLNWGGAVPESNWQLAVTMFMPMVKNLNQLGSDVTNEESWSDASTDAHITNPFLRYDHNPITGDLPAGVGRYGFRGHSGDMVKATRSAGYGHYNSTLAKFDNGTIGIQSTQQANHGGAPNPKWRLRTALACFLKDGTYTISGGGAIIPYTYDPDRNFGGFSTGQLGADKYYYGTWDGGADIAAANSDDGTGIDASAQVYGGFIQGPFCPAPQSHNINGIVSAYYEWIGSIPLTSGYDWWGGWGEPSGPLRDVTGFFPRSPGYGMSIVNPMPHYAMAGDTMQRTGTDPFYFTLEPDGSNTFVGPVGTGIANLQVIDMDSITDPAAPVTARMPSCFDDDDIPLWFGSVGAVWGANSQAGFLWSPWSVGRAQDTLAYTWHIGKRVGTTAARDGLEFITDPYWIVNLQVDATPLDLTAANTDIQFKQGVRWALMKDGLNTDNADGGAYESFWGALYPDRYMVGEKGFGMGKSTAPVGYGNIIGRMPDRVHGITPDDGRIGDWWFEPQSGGAAKFNRGGGCIRVSPARFAGAISRSTGEASSSPFLPLAVQWQHNSLEMWLLSDYESETGYNAWASVKPGSTTTTTGSGSRAATSWPMGRNRNWPGHTRAWGTKLGHQPSLMPGALDGDVTGYGAPTAKTSLTENSCSPMFIDIELQAYFPKVDGHMTRLVFEQGTSDFGRGEVGGAQSGFSISEHSTPFQTGGNPLMSARNGFGGHYVVGGSPFTSPILLPQADITSMVSPETQSQFPCSIRPDNPAVWHGGGNKMQANTAWPSVTGDNATRELPPSLAGGAWGALDGAGMGTPFSQDEGSHKWRCAFDEGGMTFYLDDAIQGKYVGAGSPVYSFKLQACSFNLDSTSSGNNDDSLEKVTEKQLYVDEITVRQVPSLAMLPFTIETTVINEDAGKYKTLTVFADNVISANDYDVKVSICTPGDTTGIWAGYGRSPGTPIADFESLDLQIAGGYGSTNLTDLPASVYVDGFTIRWEFWVPNVGSENAPVNWDSLPEISNWKITFDNMPTATCAVTGNTFNNDLSSPITTEVGHIVTFYSTGTTIDPDRLMTHVKYDFGDGTITDWIAIAVPALTVNHTITHAYSVAATALNMTAMYKDDNENESAATTAIVVNVNATNPVAALRASPMMVRAGQTVRLDGSKSYDVDSTTLTDFTFTPGDGSTAIGPQYANYADHTYAVAGEYRATLTCEDSTGNTSNMATCIIKVLPANLVIPLTLNTMPSEFSRTRQAKYHSTPVLDAAFPELRDTGQRSDKFSLRGEFLTETADVDIAFMEELLMSGALVEFEWQAVNYIGTPDSKTFVGRMTDFSYEREGGKHGQTPYTAQFTREAALGV